MPSPVPVPSVNIPSIPANDNRADTPVAAQIPASVREGLARSLNGADIASHLGGAGIPPDTNREGAGINNAASGDGSDQGDDIGSSSQALLETPCQIAEHVNNSMPRFDCIRISQPVLLNQAFTVEATASDPDNTMSALTLGVSPYRQEDFRRQVCASGNSCTKNWTLHESEPGMHTYQVKAKNDRNQIIVESVTVNVVEHAVADAFIFRTAGVEAGPYFADRAYEYIDPVMVTVRDRRGHLLGSQAGRPFATFRVDPDLLYVVNYSALGHRLDADNFFFDAELPGCSSLGCTLTQGQFTTACSYRPLTIDFECTLRNHEFNDSIKFFYKPTGDSLGANVIRVFNPMHPANGPVIRALSPITFREGGSYHGLDLDDHVTDADNQDNELLWIVSNEDHVDVLVDASHIITITPRDPSFYGTDIVTLQAEDPDGNFDSVDLLVNVTNLDNDAPFIVRFSPEDREIDVLEGAGQLFYLDVDDYEPPALQLFWTIDGRLAAQQSLIFRYNATDGPSTHTLVATVSDGANSAGHTWSVHELDTMPVADFTYAPMDVVAGFTDVAFTDTSTPAYDPITGWAWDFGDSVVSDVQNPTHVFAAAGDYDVSLTVTDSDGSPASTIHAVHVRIDDVLPVIGGITVMPDPADQNEPVTITAIVSDDVSVASVTATITSPSGLRMVTIPLVGAGIFYSGIFADTREAGVYTVQITATDASGNVAIGTATFTVNQAAGSGDSATEIITPGDGSTFTVDLIFNLNATITANGGDLTACEAEALFDDTLVSLVSGAVIQPLGDIASGDAVEADWQFAGLVAGMTNITVLTTCDAGEQSLDSVGLAFVPDTQAPSVTNVTAIPVAVLSGDPVSVTAIVTDDVAVSSVIVEITYPDMTTARFAASDAGMPLYALDMNDTTQLGQYTARVIATDLAGNVNDSETTVFYVVERFGDVSLEIVSPVNGSAFQVGSTFDLVINTSATDGDVFDCTLSLNLSNATVLSTDTLVIPIGHVFADAPVTTTIPIDAVRRGTSNINATVTCSLANSGTAGDVVGDILVTLLVDNPPVINSIEVILPEVPQGNPVDIIANVSDDDAVDTVTALITSPSGFQRFMLPLARISADLYGATFPQTMEVGTYTVTITANDTMGQVASASTAFNVTQAPGTGTTLTRIILPLDGSSMDMGQAFTVNATIAVVGGDTQACQADLLFSNSNIILDGGADPQPLGNIDSGVVMRAGWQVHAAAPGTTNITILTTCLGGLQSFDTVRVTIQPDLLAPSVQNVSATPFAVELLFPVRLSANVTDDVRVDAVLFRITKPDGTIMAFPGSAIGDIYSTSFGFTDQEGRYSVQVVANDTSDNVNDTETAIFYVVNPATVGSVSATISNPADNAAFTRGDTIDVTVTANTVGGDVFACDVTLSASDPFVLQPLGAGFIPTVTPGTPVVAHISLLAFGIGVSDLTADVTCLFGGTVSDTITNITVNAPPVPINQPPLAAITAPSNNSMFINGTQINFTGTGNDPEDGALFGASLEWSSDIDGFLGDGGSLNLSSLSLGNHTILLVARDSDGAVGSNRIIVQIVPPGTPLNNAPSAFITAPANGSLFVNGTQINFTGVGLDPEDGILPDARLAWSSSLDGVLGTGTSLNLSNLTVGNHTVTLTVTDSLGASATTGIRVQIVPQGTPINAVPVVTITAPADGSVFVNGAQINFTGVGNDPEDGALAGNSLVWTSNLNGNFGNGSSVNSSSLSLGAHVITLTGIDSLDARGTAAIVIRIVPAPGVPNAPPTVALLGPANNMQINNTQRVVFNASVTDDLSPALSCSLYLDGVLNQDNGAVPNGSVVEFTVNGLAYAAHTWRVECSDGSLNRVSETRAFSIVDTNPPFLGLISPLDGSVSLSTAVPLNYTVIDLESGVNMVACAFQLDARARVSLPGCANATINATPGVHTLTVFSADNYGNTATVLVVFTVNLNATITGTVLDNSTGLPVPNAVTQLRQGMGVISSTMTDADGNYTMIVPAGDYTLVVSAASYRQNSQAVSMPVNSTTVLNVNLTPFPTRGTLTGRIEDANNTLYGATIELTQDGVLIASATTNASGHYTISNMGIGNYAMTVFKPGYTTHREASLTIVGGNNVHNDTLVQNNAIAGSLQGTVFDLLPTPIPGATITVYRSGTREIVQVLQANAGGLYQVNGLPVLFTYDLVADAPGYAFLFGPVGAGVEAGNVIPDNDIFMS